MSWARHHARHMSSEAMQVRVGAGVGRWARRLRRRAVKGARDGGELLRAHGARSIPGLSYIYYDPFRLPAGQQGGLRLYQCTIIINLYSTPKGLATCSTPARVHPSRMRCDLSHRRAHRVHRGALDLWQAVRIERLALRRALALERAGRVELQCRQVERRRLGHGQGALG